MDTPTQEENIILDAFRKLHKENNSLYTFIPEETKIRKHRATKAIQKALNYRKIHDKTLTELKEKELDKLLYTLLTLAFRHFDPKQTIWNKDKKTLKTLAGRPSRNNLQASTPEETHYYWEMSWCILHKNLPSLEHLL